MTFASGRLICCAPHGTRELEQFCVSVVLLDHLGQFVLLEPSNVLPEETVGRGCLVVPVALGFDCGHKPLRSGRDSVAGVCNVDGSVVLAFCGLRWGEVAALRVKRVDLFRRRLTVAESVTEVSGRLAWGTPKSHQARSVPIPRSLVALLTEVAAAKGPDDLVFTTWRGRPLRNLNFRRDV